MRLFPSVFASFRALPLCLATVVFGHAAGFPMLATSVSNSMTSSVTSSGVSPLSSAWKQWSAYPSALGVAGILAGVHDGVVIAAGGANFPELPPWEGGKKKYHADIHVLMPGTNEWRSAGQLPQARGYAAVVSLPEGVLVIGGESADQVFDDTLWLRWEGERVRVTPGPRLPSATTSPVAAVLAGSVYVAAGYAAGSPRLSEAGFWRLDLANPSAGWVALPTWPGPSRGQAVMAAADGAIYLLSGLELKLSDGGKPQPRYLDDAYRYRPDSGWEPLGTMPRSAIAAPTPAPISSDRRVIYVLGGVDGRLVGKQPRDTRVPGDILAYDIGRRTWRTLAERWPDPVVTTPAFEHEGEWFFISGEIMAGVRTPHAWSWRAPADAASCDIKQEKAQ